LELDDELEEDENELLDRYHLLAAEIYGYSFANYRAHLGIGHIRFEKLMPDTARVLERAVQEDWSASRLVKELHRDDPIDEKYAQKLLNSCKDALLVVDAENAAESFRHGVRVSVARAMKDGLDDKNSLEDLVTQICYRAADLAVLLELENETLSSYSEALRRTPRRDNLGQRADQ
jgi:hypothetical protein